MNIYALVGYVLVCLWQPVQIIRILMTHEVEGISVLAVATLTVGMSLIQIGFIKDGAGWVYKWGNGFAATMSIVLLILYFVYKQ